MNLQLPYLKNNLSQSTYKEVQHQSFLASFGPEGYSGAISTPGHAHFWLFYFIDKSVENKLPEHSQIASDTVSSTKTCHI